MGHDTAERGRQHGAGTSGARASEPAIGKQTRVEALDLAQAPASAAIQRAGAGTVGAGAAGAAPEQIREAAASGARGPGGSLPHAGAIQRAFGRHDVSGIVAHTDGEAARAAGAMGAEAFATGGHVAFAGQPSLHTAAHEAAHVVQQRGGVQLAAGVGASGDAHEQHADAVANRVVAGESAEALLDGYAGAAGAMAPAGTAVQRMVTQIVPAVGQADVIQRVVTVGRPERSHGSSMGDHSTAYTLHVEGIRSQLQGKTLAQAIGELDALVRAARGLPGFAMIAQLPDERRVHVEGQWSALVAVRNRPALADPASADASALALDLQDYINAYLEFREVIPLSTINVAAKSPATAGKGKGESADALVREADGEAVPASELLAAIANLFDAKGAALVAAEPLHDMLAQLAPGVDAALGYQARAALLIDQHIASITASFPGVFAADTGVTPDAVRSALEVRILPLVLASWRADLAVWLRHEGALTAQAATARENAVLEARKTRESLEAQAAELEASAGLWRDQIGALQAEIARLDELLSELVREAQRAGAVAAPPAQDAGPASPDPAPGGGAAASDGAADDERKQPLATQLKLSPGGAITDVLSAGRSPSPFPGTMGAHSTSWVVHVDRVRGALIGKTVPEAIAELAGALLPEARAMQGQLAGVFPIRDEHQGVLDAAELAADAAIERARAASPQTQPALLQQAINALLTFINYIPGATLEAADTGGKTEGMYRGILRAAEAGEQTPRDTLREAILGLLDVKAADQPEQRAALVANHLQLIAATYPTALARAGRDAIEATALEYLALRDDGDAERGAAGGRRSTKRGRDGGAAGASTKRRRGRDAGGDSAVLPGPPASPAMPPPMAFDFTAFGAVDESPG